MYISARILSQMLKEKTLSKKQAEIFVDESIAWIENSLLCIKDQNDRIKKLKKVKSGNYVH